MKSNSHSVRRVIAATVSVLAGSTLIGCAATVPLQRSQIDAISRGASPELIERTLGKAMPTAQFEFASNETSFLVRHFILQTGSRQEMTMVCTTFCVPVFTAVAVTAPYLIVQRIPSRALHAWGTIEELSKDAEPSVSSIMPALKARLEVVLAESKR